MVNYQKISIPKETAAITEARKRLVEARRAREEAQAKHVEARRLYQAQTPGKAAEITVAEVDALALKISVVQKAEEAASAALSQAVAQHRAEVLRSVKAPLREMERDLIDAYACLAVIVAEGARLTIEARRAGVELPSAAPAVCAQIEAALMPTIRRLLHGGGLFDL